jgi:hypothetical protein
MHKSLRLLAPTQEALNGPIGYVPLPVPGKIHTLAALHRQRCDAARLIAIRDAAVVFSL